MNRNALVPLLVAFCAALASPCRPKVTALECATDLDCGPWGAFAPICHDGMCSECDDDRRCVARLGRPAMCVDNDQGFGTCLPYTRVHP